MGGQNNVSMTTNTLQKIGVLFIDYNIRSVDK